MVSQYVCFLPYIRVLEVSVTKYCKLDGLKQLTNLLPQNLKAVKWRCQQGWFLLRSVGVNWFGASPTFWRQSAVPGIPWLVTPTPPPSSGGILCVSLSPYKDTMLD